MPRHQARQTDIFYRIFTVLCLVLYVPLGILFSLLFYRDGRFQYRDLAIRWLIIGSGLLVPLVVQLSQGTIDYWLVGVLAVLVLVSPVFVFRGSTLAIGLHIALMILCAGFALENYTARTSWHAFVDNGVQLNRFFATFFGSETISGSEGRLVFNRFWQTSKPVESGIRFEAEMRHVDGIPDWEWYEYNPDFQLQQIVEDGIPFTRIVTPTDNNSTVTRRLRTGSSLAGRTFRARLELRSTIPYDSDHCGGLIIREELGLHSRLCKPVSIGPNWETYELEWTPGPEIVTDYIRLELRLTTPHYDVRNVELAELIDDEWHVLTPLEPTYTLVSLAIPGVPSHLWPAQGIAPTEDWSMYTREYKDDRLLNQSDVRTVLRIEEGTTVEIRNVGVSTLNGDVLTSAPSPGRSQLWWTDPNLAGHTSVTIGLVLMTAVRSWPIILLAGALSAVAVFFTASRAALLALLLGFIWVLYLQIKGSRTHRTLIIAGFLIAAIAVGGIVGTEALGRLQIWNLEDGNSVTRVEIWKFAWQKLWSEPIYGFGHDSFSSQWLQAHTGDSRPAPTHAHNLWLQLGFLYGVPGLIGSIWMTLALIHFAWVNGRSRGLALLIPIFLMNFFDYSLFYQGVMYVWLLGMNSMHKTRPAKHPAPNRGLDSSKQQLLEEQ